VEDKKKHLGQYRTKLLGVEINSLTDIQNEKQQVRRGVYTMYYILYYVLYTIYYIQLYYYFGWMILNGLS
jgi:hypothetical protein